MTSSTASLTPAITFGKPIERHTSESNILKLKLKKPKSWNWELSTSTSSTHIAFPRILLYDDENRLLADVDDADCIISGSANSGKSSKHSECSLKHSNSFNSTKINRTSSVSHKKASPNYQAYSIERHRSDGIATQITRKKCKRSASTNTHDVNGMLAEFVSQLKEQGYECKINRNSSNAQSGVHKSLSNIAKAHNKRPPEVFEPYAMRRKCIGDNLNLATKTATAAAVLHPSQINDLISNECIAIEQICNDSSDKDDVVMMHCDENFVECTQKSIDINNTVIDVMNDNDIEMSDELKTGSNRQPYHHIDAEQPNILTTADLQRAAAIDANGDAATAMRREHKIQRSRSLSDAIYRRNININTTQPSYAVQREHDEDDAFKQLPFEYRKPVYHLRKCAAGTIIVPEVEPAKLLLYRQRNRTTNANSMKKSFRPNTPEELNRSLINQTNCHPKENRFDGIDNNSMDDNDIRKRSELLMGNDDEDDERLKFHLTHSNADKYPSRYHKAMANIDNLITNVILSHAMHIKNNKYRHGAESICIDPNHLLNVRMGANVICATLPANQNDAQRIGATVDSNNRQCRVDSINSTDDNRKNIDENVIEQSVLIRSENNRLTANGCSETNVTSDDVIGVDGVHRHCHRHRHRHSYRHHRTTNNGVNDSCIECCKQKRLTAQCNRDVSFINGSGNKNSDGSLSSALRNGGGGSGGGVSSYTNDKWNASAAIRRKNSKNGKICRSASAVVLCSNSLAISSASTSSSSSNDESEDIDAVRTMQRKKRRYAKQLKKLKTTHQQNGKSILA